MPLVILDKVSIHYGPYPLLVEAAMQVDAGERVCVIGRNGTGKSTLLKLITGTVLPDAGSLWRQPGLRIGALLQDLPETSDASVFDIIAAGLPEQQRLLSAYHASVRDLGSDPTPSQLRQLETLQHQLEACDAWQLNQRIEQTIGRLQLPTDARLSELSGGWRRRVALGQALVSDPELLILDEPTNHLDLEAIEWLEEQLLAYRGGLLFVTHDRALLQRLATRIVDLDRGLLTSWPGNYQQFLSKKTAALAAEERHFALFDKKLAQEEVWIRQGIKARRTRNEGRVRALKALREQRRQRREQVGQVEFRLDAADVSGDLVINVEQASCGYEGRLVVRDLSLRIMRGDRIGIIGPNGAGKSTLIRLLLGELEPSAGKIKRGTNLRIAYFDQLRACLDPLKSIIDNVAEGREAVTVNGQTRHVIGYLQDFLFTPDRIHVPVHALSGGERNRLLLARLFSQPCNVLVMDEPTNDLDIETLELLEELLAEFKGTLLLVSHDRQFLDNVVTSTLVFEGQGLLREYVGGYSDWLNQRGAGASTRPAAKTPPVGKTTAPRRTPDNDSSRKLTFNEKRELEQLPATITGLEAEQSALTAEVSAADFYRRDRTRQDNVFTRLRELEAELATAYARWDALDSRPK